MTDFVRKANVCRALSADGKPLHSGHGVRHAMDDNRRIAPPAPRPTTIIIGLNPTLAGPGWQTV